MQTNVGEFQTITFLSGETSINWTFTLMELLQAPWFYKRVNNESTMSWMITDEFIDFLDRYELKEIFLDEVSLAKSITAKNTIFIPKAMFAEMRLTDVIVSRS